MELFKHSLNKTGKLKIQKGLALSAFTSIGLGGRARYFAEAYSTSQICEALEWAKAKKLRLQVIGGGSNIVFSDSGFDGLVLKIATEGLSFFPGKASVEINECKQTSVCMKQKKSNESISENKVEKTRHKSISVQAGANWDDFVLFCCKEGLSGLECLSGIPGSVGASPIQNIGAYGQELADSLQEVICMDRQSFEVIAFSNQECNFSYRQSRFKGKDKDRYIILEVRFLLSTELKIRSAYPELLSQLEKNGIEPNRPASLMPVRELVLALRKKKSMLLDANDPNSRSCGSFFLNPVLDAPALFQFQKRVQAAGLSSFPAFPAGDKRTKIPAAWLIEHSGFTKGYRYKGLGISPKHALAIVNYSGTSSELREFQTKICTAVKERFGISLSPEPVLFP